MTIAIQPPTTGITLSDRVPNEVIMALETSSLRIPFEEARRYSRANQRIVEKDLPTLAAQFGEKQALAEDLEGLEARYQERLRQLLEKVDEHGRKERDNIRRLEERTKFLNTLLSDQRPDNPKYSEWMSLRLKRLIVEYYLNKGDLGEGMDLMSKFAVSDWVDAEVYLERHRIATEMTDHHSFAAALAWCSENRQALKKGKSSLEFSLRRQEMIEMAGRGEINEAIAYGRKHLYPWLSSQSSLAEWTAAETAMLAFCFQSDKNDGQDIVTMFMKEYNGVYELPKEAHLMTLLQAGLTLIKTPNCGDPEHYNVNCPACQPELAAIAAHLPYAHHDYSSLVCRITGQIINEDNPPMALPNGHVYSAEGLCKISREDCVKCPRTGDTFQWDQLRKVYIT